MKKRVGNKRRIKSTVNVAAVPHHTKLGSFAGMTIKQIFTPGNGIDVDTFVGSKALYIAAHIDSPKKVEAMINEKHQLENNTNEDLVKEKMFNYRFVNALKHKFGPNNLDQSRAALERAQEDDQARQNYIAMLVADDSSESNPYSICTFAGCRRYHASQSSSSASTPAASSHATPSAADADIAPALVDETSSEDQMSASYAAAADTISGPSTRLCKRNHDSESDGSETEPPMKAGSKRRKMKHGGVKDGEHQMGASYTPSLDAAHSAVDSDDDSCLDPALREGTHSATSQYQSKYTPVAAPAAYSAHAVSVQSPSTAAALAQHHSGPQSDAQPDSAIKAAGDQASTVTENAHTSEQAPEIDSGLSPHGAGSTSSAPYHHGNSGALDLSGQDVYITISPEQLDELYREENDAFLREEFVNEDFGTAPDKPFDSDADWRRHVGDSLQELYPELGVSGHYSEGDSGYHA